MRKRTVWAMTAAALVVGGVIGFAVHAPGRSGTWDDVQKWVTFLVIVLGLPTALYQLNLQRLQLRDQQAVIEADAERGKRRDELLDRQLLELEQRALTTERAQAEQVEFSWRASSPVDESMEGTIWMGVTENRSSRPIRDVVCRIQLHPAQDYDFSAQAVGELTALPMGSAANMPVFIGARLGDRVALIRGGQTFGFQSSIPVADHQLARMITRFTDDAGIHWQIDADLHLEKLASRNW
jgi:hypothetical protein